MSSDTQAGRAIDRYDRFVQHIIKICRDEPERRASLRRGLGRAPEQAYGMHATVATWLPDRPGRAEEHAFYAVASMIAAQSPSGRRADESTSQTDAGETGEADTDVADGTEVEPAAGPEPRRPVRRPSLGFALARAVIGTETARRSIGEGTAEKRLQLLVRQDLPGVHRHLPGLVRHIRSLDIPVDWAQLIYDLRRWDQEWDRDLVAKRWLQDYYRTVNREERA